MPAQNEGTMHSTYIILILRLCVCLCVTEAESNTGYCGYTKAYTEDAGLVLATGKSTIAICWTID